MVNEIIKGVSMKLSGKFKGYRVYQNDVRQGLKLPCFFISVLKPDISPLGRDRFMSRNPLDVMFFPEDESDNNTMLEVAERLVWLLELITLPDGDMLHGTDKSWHIEGGILHFFVSFDHTLTRARDEDKIESADISVGTDEN